MTPKQRKFVTLLTQHPLNPRVIRAYCEQWNVPIIRTPLHSIDCYATVANLARFVLEDDEDTVSNNPPTP